MNFLKDVTITFCPLRIVVALMGIGACLLFLGTPTKLSPATAAPRTLTPAEVALQKEIDVVESELSERVRGATVKEVRLISETIVKEAHANRFDPLFVLAIIEAESNYDTEACSKTGARGLMQILRSTFKSVSDSPKMFDPVENIKAGVKYLAQLGTSFKRVESILMAYNGGPGNASAYLRAVQEGWDVEEFSSEMKNYPAKVMGKYAKLLIKNGRNPKAARTLYRIP